MIIKIENIIKISTNSIYSGTHWTKRKKIKEDYLKLTKNIFKDIEPITRKVDLNFSFFFSGKTFDSSNCSYMAKILEDCLVEHKVLKDDNIKYVGNFNVLSQKSTIKTDYCILTINNHNNDK